MLNVLLESRRARSAPPVAGATASALAHAGVVALLLLGSGTAVTAVSGKLTQILEFLIPPSRAAEAPAEKLRFLSAGAGGGAPGIAPGPARSVPPSDGLGMTAEKAAAKGTEERAAVPAPEPTVPDNAFSIVEVDSAAVRDPSSAAPEYPKSMREKSIDGFVALRFVVDSTGLIDPGTVQVLDSSRPEFVKAVRDAVPLMRFKPAKMGAIPVRQLAEQLFKFHIATPVPATAPAKKP